MRMRVTKMSSEPAFKIHVAKAKDLPLAWYELVLRPDKFAAHLETLKHNPDASPSAPHLIITFLDKSGVYSALSNSHSSLSFTDVTGEKEVKLVKCALMVASCLFWNSPHLWKELPLSVQFCLVSLLSNHYPSPEMGVVSNEGTIAHVIYSEWVLRFVVEQCHSSHIPSRTPVQTWDTTCVPTEQIKELVKSKSKEALNFLTEFLKAVESLADGELPKNWAVPRVCVDLPVLSSGEIHLEPFKEGGSGGGLFSEHLCQIEFVVGCYHFVEADYHTALHHFKRTQQLLSRTSGGEIVDNARLAGFLLACESMAGRETKDVPHREDSLERHLREAISEGGDIKGSPECEECSQEEEKPNAKRQKISSVDISLSLDDRVVLCSCLRNVLEGKAPCPQLWQLLGQQNYTPYLKFLFQLCGKFLKGNLHSKEKVCLQTFLRSLRGSYCGDSKSLEKLLPSAVTQELRLHEDSVMDKYLNDGETQDKISYATSSSVEQLERTVGQATCSSEVLAAVENLYRVVPSSQHRNISLKWVGSSRGFAPVEGVADLVSVTKYNCLVHRAQVTAKTQMYRKSHELFTGALSSLKSISFLGSKVRQLETYLQEQLLVTELISLDSSSGSEGRGSWSKKHTSLLEKSRAYYVEDRHWSGLDSSTLHVVGAFLLNMHEFSFLSQRENNQGPNSLAPRLASAIINIKERKDLRKSTRSLFETVVFFFSPLLHSNEGKVELNERQSRLRTNLNLFIRNLTDNLSLSLLTAALARIWNMIEKPEEEIVTEFSGYWPTAIGNASNIDAGQVLHMLNVALNHALLLQPHNTSWIITKANVHSAVGEYGAALEGYMEAAALATNHFHREIPEGVWSQAILRRLISCCCKFSYFTQAAILCQLLHPVDYELAFSILRENCHATMDSFFPYFWDMTIIEYLIYVHSQMDSNKQAVAIQVAGQADLNFNNSVEVLRRAAQVRRRKFLRTFYTQIIHAI